MKRKASAEWNGDLKSGKGAISTDSGVLSGTPYSFTTRFENGKGTNPEELIAAAHAGCIATFTDTDAPYPRYMIAMISVPLHLLRGEIGAAIEAARDAIAAADTIDEEADRREARGLGRTSVLARAADVVSGR